MGSRRMGLGESAVLQKASTSFDQSIAVRLGSAAERSRRSFGV